jgi:poly(A) RNA polymerase, mitochondrial
MKHRNDEAEKSILVQVSSDKSYTELSHYCSQFGNIKSSFHFKVKDENNFILLEYETIEECQEALKYSMFNPRNSGIPVASPFLWFRASSSKKIKSVNKSSKEIPKLILDNIKLIEDEDLNKKIIKSQSIDEQIKTLYESTRLNDLGYRMRFLLSRQLKDAIKGIFHLAEVHPFGSSVNGFGKIGCDLDIVMMLNIDHNHTIQNDSRLIYHTKEYKINDRAQIQQNLVVVGDIMHLFLPGISNVRRILQARVPILKFNHECLNLDVDLSMNSLTAIYMSELLYIFGELDERVRPLMFSIRKWASTTGVTNPIPGRWISNFQLSCLVLFFLQTLQKPILPSLKLLKSLAREEDVRISEDNNDCTFLRDLNELKFERRNNENLLNLLKQFFEYYAQFDFGTCGISLIEGTQVTKLDRAATSLLIINPFEPELNVSKNVSYEEIEKFQFEAKNAAWILESYDDDKCSDKESWGLPKIFKSFRQIQVKPEMFYKSRLVYVSDLFKDGSEQDKIDRNLKLKNTKIKAEIEKVKKATRKEILELGKSRSKNL